MATDYTTLYIYKNQEELEEYIRDRVEKRLEAYVSESPYPYDGEEVNDIRDELTDEFVSILADLGETDLDCAALLEDEEDEEDSGDTF